ncbi:AAA family ATPase, partial [Pseudomonas syringae group genomosp. 7]|uniref:AAA family ATPase n=1 Tax=Pseudomonas syringae group genomosp. 7 TaxID=251699 RepID=UPI00376FA566
VAHCKSLREWLEQGARNSMIFWGPPGLVKTSLARLLAKVSYWDFESVSAVLSGVIELRAAVEVALPQAGQYGKLR